MTRTELREFWAVTAKAQQLLWETLLKLAIAHNVLAEYAVDFTQLLRIAAGIKLQTLRYYAGSEKAALRQAKNSAQWGFFGKSGGLEKSNTNSTGLATAQEKKTLIITTVIIRPFPVKKQPFSWRFR